MTNPSHYIPFGGRVVLQRLLILVALLWIGAAHALDTVTLQLKWSHQFQFAGYYAAIENGYFREEGLDIELRERSPDSAPVSDVLAGKAQYGITDSSLIISALGDEPVVLVSQIFQHSPLVFITLTDSGIDSPADMAGRRVMTDPSGITDAPLLALIKAALGGLEKVQLVEHTFRNEDLLEGKVDVIAGYLTDRPFLFREQGAKVKIIDPRDYGIDFYGDNLFTTRKELVENPQRVERMRRATLKGWHYALNHVDEMIDLILSKYNQAGRLTREYLTFEAKETRRMIAPELIELGELDPTRFQRIAAIYQHLDLTEQGEIDRGFFFMPKPFRLSRREKAYLEELEHLRVPLVTGQPPLSFVRDGVPAGYLNELLEYVTAALGLDLQRVHDVSYAESLELLEQQDADLLNDYSVDSSSNKHLLTTPVLSVPFVAVGRTGSRPVRTVTDLRDRRIVAVSGFQQTRALREHFPELDVVLVDGTAEAYRSLRSRDADIYIDNATHAGYRLRQSMVSDLQIVGELPAEQLGVLRLRFAIAQRHSLLHSAVEKVLAAIPQDMLQALRDRWLHTQLTETADKFSLTAEESAFLAAHPVIRVALDPSWAPIEYRDEQGDFRGMSLDYLAHLEAMLGVRFEVAKALPTWAAAVDAVRHKQVDMFAAVSRTPARESFSHFTPPYLHLPIHIFARDEVTYIGTAGNLKNRKVAVVEGYAIEEWLTRDFPEIKLVKASSPAQALEAVVDGEVDAFVGNLVTTTYYLGKLGIENVRAVGDSGYSNSLSMAVRKDWPLLEKILSKGLQHFTRDEHNLIFDRWMDIRFERQIDYRLISQLGLISILLLTFILYWNRRLSVEIGNRKQAENALLEHKAQLEQRVETRTTELRAINEALRVEIRDREQVEEKLRVAAAVFANTAEGVAITDLDAKVIDVNEAFSKITGYSKGEVLGKNPSILKSGRHDPSYYQAMWQALDAKGQWRGEIWNRRQNGQIFPELLTISVVRDEHGQPQGYVGVFADISTLKETEDRLEHLAHHDALTGLPNRLLLNARLEQAVNHASRHKRVFALVFIDLDRFKRINDTLGHQTGDALLVAVADRLQAKVRAEDTVARISGDEFVVLLENVDDTERVLVTTTKLMSVFQTTFDIEGTSLDITASMGVSLYPNDCADGEVLLRYADAAMYRAKEEGRNTLEFYTREMSAQVLEHAFFESALRSAISQNQLRLVYQPQVDIETRQLLGLEALLRWEHPERGNIPPARFIPVAEQSRLIRDIGSWVLEQACFQAKEWLDLGLVFGRVAVNMSGQQMMANNLLEVVNQALNKSGLAASALELEVTESFAMRRADEQVTRLQTLREMGITLAIDDFGTGYSSLSYLKQLPVDKLKIDRSFVLDIPDDENDMAICETVIAMGRALGLDVIAEGVETDQQAEFLLMKQCRQAQGYLFSKPLEAGATREFLADAAFSDKPETH